MDVKSFFCYTDGYNYIDAEQPLQYSILMTLVSVFA